MRARRSAIWSGWSAPLVRVPRVRKPSKSAALVWVVRMDRVFWSLWIA